MRRIFPVVVLLTLLRGASGAQSESPDSAAALARLVYARLVATTGTGLPAPELHVQTRQEASRLPVSRRLAERVAFLRPLPGTLPRYQIVIDEQTIQLCRQIAGEAEGCVAFFLGHELAHYVNHHDWGPHFARMMQGVADALEVASPDLRQRAAQEAQADDLGMLYAALAGFDSFAVAPQAIAAVYRDYAIPQDLPGYLKLSERQLIAERSRSLLQRLLPLFDAGSLCIALGRFEAAASLYEAILLQFPSREIYNNAGISRARLAAAPDADKYPWLLDGATRLPEPARRGEEIAVPLAVAAAHLDKAIALDPNYAVAHANRGLVAIAQTEFQRALAEFATAGKLGAGSAAIESAIHLGEAIALFQQNHTTEARQILEERLSQNGEDPLARWWWRRITGAESPAPSPNAESSPAIGRSELWPGGIRPKNRRTARPERETFDKFMIESAIDSKFRWFSIRFIGGSPATLTALVISDSSFAPPVLPIGAAMEDWQKHLGSPSAELGLFPGQAFLFENLGLLIKVDAAGRVRQEIIYE
jgi:tetratricopeptide (TPR) repeat protein